MVAGKITGSPPADFRCPHCKATYKRISQAAEDPQDLQKPVACTKCGKPLPASEGGNILKYFLCSK